MKNRHTPEQIVRKLRETEAKLAAGASIPEVARQLGIREATFQPTFRTYERAQLELFVAVCTPFSQL